MKLLLKNVKIECPHLFVSKNCEDRNYNDNYSADFLIYKSDDDTLRSVIDRMHDAAKRDLNGVPNNIDFRFLKDGRDERQYDFNSKRTLPSRPDHMILRTKNSCKPLVIDDTFENILESDSQIVSGCYVNAIVYFTAHSANGENIVEAELRGVQYISRAEKAGKFGNISKPSEFDRVPRGLVSAPDDFELITNYS